MSDKKKRKKKRSPAELLAAKRRELQKLEERVRRQKIEKAIKAGNLSEEKEKEFKALKRKATVMRKAASIFDEAGEDESAVQADKLASRFGKAMSVIVDEADEAGNSDGSEDEDEEYEEEDGEDGEDGEDEEYEDEEEEEEEDDD